MSPITTHVFDTAKGRPARGVPITLEIRDKSGEFREVGRGVTDDDGRLKGLLEPGSLAVAVYRITFETGAYFKADGIDGFYPTVPVVFEIRETTAHYHVPLLISPFGFSTYRGS